MFHSYYLIGLYEKQTGESLSIEEASVILSKIRLFLKYVKMNINDLLCLMDDLYLFKKEKKLQLIDEDLFKLMAKIMLDDENSVFSYEDSLYLMQDIQCLLLPSDKLISSDMDEEKIKDLTEFDIFISKIVKNISCDKLFKIKKYNDKLFNILKDVMNLYQEYQKEHHNTLDFYEIMIVNTTIFHLITLYYLNQDEYDETLLIDACQRIIDNMEEFINYCHENDIYSNLLTLSYEELIEEYKICDNILKYCNNLLKKKKRS